MSLQSIYELRRQPVLIGATTAACMTAAEAILNEAGSTPNHANRIVWANTSPDANALEIMPSIAMNSTIQTKWADRTLLNLPEQDRYDDADIQFVVDSNINRFAVGESSITTTDLTLQGAAIAATPLYLPPASGLFRISVCLQVTRAATTSSVLGGGTGLVLTFTEPDGSVAQTLTMALATATGGIATTASGNSTTTKLSGVAVVNAKAGIPIQYAVGYTSAGATSMQYSVHLRVEAL